ncbi:MAG TPA: hypothetical protein VJT75_00660 [Thermoleophilaceae bacterium]|nr:hypothetical protein [Thermoleophilaceae bacterium]
MVRRAGGAGVAADTGSGANTGAAPGARAAELVEGFEPENELEAAVAADPDLLEGLAWGKPRKSHPEGRICNHVADLLRAIDARDESPARRAQLRFVALVHDSFKGDVRSFLPKSGENHHAMRARRFAERYTGDEVLLATIELHDRPYAIWKKMRRKGRLDEDALDEVFERVPDHDLFLSFIEVDGSSEAKDQDPIRWLRGEMEGRGLVPARHGGT